MTDPTYDVVQRGGCRCGKVRFEARGAPLRVGVCHCESCRRATGGAFAVFVDYPRMTVAFSGEPAVWSSRPGVERLFCDRCGSPIGFRDDDEPPETNLYLGAFARHAAFGPPHDVTHEEEALEWARSLLAPLTEESER